MKNWKKKKSSTQDSRTNSYSIRLNRKETIQVENSQEPHKNLTDAPEAIGEFHNKHPEAPGHINGVFFKNIPWKRLENYTSLNKQKGIDHKDPERF